VEHDSRRITFGQQIGRLDIGGFVLTETFHKPGVILPRHDHECANFNLTLDGAFRETLGSCPQECEAGSVLVKPAGESHADKYGHKGAHCLIIELSPRRLDEIRSFTNLLDSPAHLRRGVVSQLSRRIYHEFSARVSGFEMVIEGLILEMLGQAARHHETKNCGASPRWLRQAQELIHQQFAEKLSLQIIADAVQIHPSHLARSFRTHHHCSVGEYVRRLRVEYAAGQILESDASLPEISLAAGFSDQSHFTREFKRRLAVTPAHYKRLRLRNTFTKKH